MSSSYIPILILIFLVIFPMLRAKRAAAILAAQNRKENPEMEELAKTMIGKECIVDVVAQSSGAQGTIVAVEGGALLLRDLTPQQNEQIINLQYVTRIRAYPRNKKGKRNAVVLD